MVWSVISVQYTLLYIIIASTVPGIHQRFNKHLQKGWSKTGGVQCLTRQWLCIRCPWGRERLPTPVFLGFPCGSAGKESACNAGDLGSIPGLGRSPGGGNGYPLQFCGLENSMDESMGLQRVGHNWVTFTSLTCITIQLVLSLILTGPMVPVI